MGSVSGDLKNVFLVRAAGPCTYTTLRGVEAKHVDVLIYSNETKRTSIACTTLFYFLELDVSFRMYAISKPNSKFMFFVITSVYFMEYTYFHHVLFYLPRNL